jgi:two-component system, chemotaxis family, protein-glutamate methylesterase/glutaminase
VESKISIEATCPDCRGPLSIRNTDGMLDVVCLIGHVYTPRTLLLAHAETQENALWAAVVSLAEVSSIVEALSNEFAPEVMQRLRAQAKKKLDQAAVVRRVIEELEVPDL